MKHGFLIIDFMLALLIGSLIIAMAGRAVLILMRYYNQVSRQCTDDLMVDTAIEQMRTDMRGYGAILMTQTSSCIWRKGMLDYGFELVNGKLIRSSGVYNVAQRRWTSRVHSVVLMHVARLNITVDALGIRCNITTNVMERSFFVHAGRSSFIV